MYSIAIEIHVIGKKILLKMPKNEADLDFVRSLRYSRWSTGNFHWEISNYPGNLDKIKRYFGDRITKIVEDIQVEQSQDQLTTFLPGKNQVFLLKDKGQLNLRFLFHEELIKAIKRIPYYRWDTIKQQWTVPFT